MASPIPSPAPSKPKTKVNFWMLLAVDLFIACVGLFLVIVIINNTESAIALESPQVTANLQPVLHPISGPINDPILASDPLALIESWTAPIKWTPKTRNSIEAWQYNLPNGLTKNVNLSGYSIKTYRIQSDNALIADDVKFAINLENILTDASSGMLVLHGWNQNMSAGGAEGDLSSFVREINHKKQFLIIYYYTGVNKNQTPNSFSVFLSEPIAVN